MHPINHLATIIATALASIAAAQPCPGVTQPPARNIPFTAFDPGDTVGARVVTDIGITDTRLAVYDGVGNLLDQNNGSSVPGIQDQVTLPPLTAGRYFIGVTHAANTFGPNFAVTPGPGQQAGPYLIEFFEQTDQFFIAAAINASLPANPPGFAAFYSFIVETPVPAETTDFGFINRISDDTTNSLVNIAATTDGFTPQFALYNSSGTLVQPAAASIDTTLPADVYYLALTETGVFANDDFFVDVFDPGIAGGTYTLTLNQETCTGTLVPGATKWFRFHLSFIDAYDIPAASLGLENAAPPVIETPAGSPLTTFAVWDQVTGQLLDQRDTAADAENIFSPALPAGAYVFAASHAGRTWSNNLGYSGAPPISAASTSLSINGIPTNIQFDGDVEWFRGVIHEAPPISGSYAESIQTSEFDIRRFGGNLQTTIAIWDEAGDTLLSRTSGSRDIFGLQLDPGQYTMAVTSGTTDVGDNFTLLNRQPQTPFVNFSIDGIDIPVQLSNGTFTSPVRVGAPTYGRPANAEFLSFVVEAPTDLGTVAAANQFFTAGAPGFPPAISRSEAILNLDTGAIIAANNNIQTGVIGLGTLFLPPGNYAFAVARNANTANLVNFIPGSFRLDREPAPLNLPYTGTINNTPFGRDLTDRPIPGMFNNADFYTFTVDSCSPADTALPAGILDTEDAFTHLLQAALNFPAADLLPGDGLNFFDTLEYLRLFDQGCP